MTHVVTTTTSCCKNGRSKIVPIKAWFGLEYDGLKEFVVGVDALKSCLEFLNAFLLLSLDTRILSLLGPRLFETGLLSPVEILTKSLFRSLAQQVPDTKFHEINVRVEG